MARAIRPTTTTTTTTTSSSGPQRAGGDPTPSKTPREKLRLAEKQASTAEGNQVHKAPRGGGGGGGGAAGGRARTYNRGSGGRKLRAGSVRLVSADGLMDRGRLEIFYRGVWGTVCDDLFNRKAAAVVCRQLGFAAPLAVMKRAVLGEGEDAVRILLDDVECRGDERTLLECKRSKVGTHNCSHQEDVGVICSYHREEE
ncbi:hypothetical protein NHX12_008833 [Muraenolepis orangiensis]|uniref:SRCR domain-containing protein n=1 Tax=Muraenolepis orangiensis TaxID=630683 RepID=A0A9Q0DPL8_9TELE|nr:hypothetical protein NHX12_008833 [Muraenolepis orangiensis]